MERLLMMSSPPPPLIAVHSRDGPATWGRQPRKLQRGQHFARAISRLNNSDNRLTSVPI